MSDKQLFFAIIGGLIFAVIGALIAAGLEAAIGMVVHIDTGDDGIGLLTLAFIVVIGITGFFISARWLKRRQKSSTAC